MRLFAFISAFLLLSCGQKKVEPPSPILPVPTQSQLEWHHMEMNAFVHFTTNTFTNKEWGYGDESPAIFNPTSFDADQWVRTFKETGFKGVILTCKHHDGFCLWPSAFTIHSVKNSPWENGNGDVVKVVAEACKKYDLKFGIYLSPWDRNHKDYGSPAYLTYYRNQLEELFKNYGPVFEMWFDGANGGDGYYGGKQEARKIVEANYYDWPTTLELVRKQEPNIIFFSDAGPGVRWVGNERGIAGETNWNTITPDTLYAGKAGIENLLNTGSENGTAWIPAEVDVSIRPGWFYHPDQDSLVKSPEMLFEIYLTSVGRGSTLLLNIPPDRRGRIHEIDSASLAGFKKILQDELGNDLLPGAKITASSYRGNSEQFAPQNAIQEKQEDFTKTYWATDDGVTTGSLEITLVRKEIINYVILQEFIKLGQRVTSFKVESMQEDSWIKVAEGTTVGYKRILKLSPINTDKIRVSFSAKACLAISNIEFH